MKSFIVAFFTLVSASAVSAEGRSVLFSDDPLVLPGEGYHAMVETSNMWIEGTECYVQVDFPEGEVETYLDDDYEIQKISIDGSAAMTIPDIVAAAQATCWPE